MLRSLLLTVAAAGLSVPAVAQYGEEDPSMWHSGQWYISGTAVQTFDRDIEGNDSIANGEPISYLGEFDPEWSGVAAVGLHIGPMRAELEGGYREKMIESIDNLAVGATGEVGLTSIMFNVYYDKPIIPRRLDAYIGGGAGFTLVDTNIAYDSTVTVVDLNDSSNNININGIEGDLWSASFQVMAGLALHVTDNVAITGGYRGFYLSETEYDSGAFLGDTFFHGIDLGLRITF